MHLGGCDGDLDKSATRKDRTRIDYMLRKIREELRVDMVLPVGAVGIRAPSEQRVAAAVFAAEDINLIGRVRHLQDGRLERQDREACKRIALAATARHARRDAVGDGAGKRLRDRVTSLDRGLSLQGADHDSRMRRMLGDFTDIVRQNRTRRNLDEEVAAEV